MTKKKTKKVSVKKTEIEKKFTKKVVIKPVKKKSLIKRIDEENDDSCIIDASKAEDAFKVKTEIVINNGIVVVNPIYNPFDENNKD